MKKIICALLFVALFSCRIDGSSVVLCVRYCQEKGGVNKIDSGLADWGDECLCSDGSRILTHKMREKYEIK